MKQKSLIDINGITYMSVKAAGERWNISSGKVSQACKDGRVSGAIKDSSNHYIIPMDSKKPLDKEMIRMTMIALLAIKNRPDTSLSLDNTDDLFLYLQAIDLIEGVDLYSSTLTNKGMELATSGKVISIDWKNAATTIIGIIGSLASIWSSIQL